MKGRAIAALLFLLLSDRLKLYQRWVPHPFRGIIAEWVGEHRSQSQL
jgi:hypothetical protein